MPVGVRVLAAATLTLAVLGAGDMAGPQLRAEPFVGLPPAPGPIGTVRRRPDGTIEPVAPVAPNAGSQRRRAATRPPPPSPDFSGGDPLPDIPWTATQQPSRSVQPQFVEPPPTN